MVVDPRNCLQPELSHPKRIAHHSSIDWPTLKLSGFYIMQRRKDMREDSTLQTDLRIYPINNLGLT